MVEVESNVDRGASRLNIPNLLCVIRLVGSFALPVLAWMQFDIAFLVAAYLLLFTDLIDGRLARRWHQRTTFGARLDTLADICFFGLLTVGLWIIAQEELADEVLWLAMALGSYAVTAAACLLKFSTLPSYHTRMAKTGWPMVMIAATVVVVVGESWPVRIATIWVTLTNMETLAMTLMLENWRADIASVYHAWKLRHAPKETDAE